MIFHLSLPNSKLPGKKLDQLEIDAHIWSSSYCRKMDHRTQIYVVVLICGYNECFNLASKKMPLPASLLHWGTCTKFRPPPTTKLENYCLLYHYNGQYFYLGSLLCHTAQQPLSYLLWLEELQINYSNQAFFIPNQIVCIVSTKNT